MAFLHSVLRQVYRCYSPIVFPAKWDTRRYVAELGDGEWV